MPERSYARDEITLLRTFLGALIGAVMWLSLLVTPGAGFRAHDGATIVDTPAAGQVAETSSILAGQAPPASISYAP